jgi:hypothetical protein
MGRPAVPLLPLPSLPQQIRNTQTKKRPPEPEPEEPLTVVLLDFSEVRRPGIEPGTY